MAKEWFERFRGPGVSSLEEMMKRTVIAIILTPIFAVAVFPGETRRSAINSFVALIHRTEPLKWTRTQLAEIRQDMTARHPNLAGLNGRKLALEIQRIAYERIKLGSRPGDLEGDLFKLYHDAVVSQTTSYSCQGKGLIFRAMLTAFDLKTRAVMFYATADQGPGEVVNSHATSDVFLDGRWEAIDSTFNFHLEDIEGKHLDWLTAYDRIHGGEKVDVVVTGSPSKDPLAEAGIILDRDMQFLAVIGRDISFRPTSWDGTYRIKDRMHWNVASESFSADNNFPLIVDNQFTSPMAVQ